MSPNDVGWGDERDPPGVFCFGNHSNDAALNVVPTGPTEISIDTTPFRHFTLRTDGFASVHAGADLGEMLTHLVRSLASRWPRTVRRAPEAA